MHQHTCFRHLAVLLTIAFLFVAPLSAGDENQSDALREKLTVRMGGKTQKAMEAATSKAARAGEKLSAYFQTQSVEEVPAVRYLAIKDALELEQALGLVDARVELKAMLGDSYMDPVRRETLERMEQFIASKHQLTLDALGMKSLDAAVLAVGVIAYGSDTVAEENAALLPEWLRGEPEDEFRRWLAKQ